MNQGPRVSAHAIRQHLKNDQLVTRYAPSPTGLLHMGHLVNAIYVWGIARGFKGQIVLRLEDHDRQRSRPEYEAALLEDLERLGFVPDKGTYHEFRRGNTDYRQSDCDTHYQSAWNTLKKMALGYACDCSRKTIRQRTGQAPGEEIRYDSYCLDRDLPLNNKHNWRVSLPPHAVKFEDLLAGKQHQIPSEQSGDPPLRDRHKNWTYQHCAAVDDLRHNINCIIRGTDILPSTGRQELLKQILQPDYTQPIFAHHNLLLNEKGQKLSKQTHAPDLHQRLQNGESPQDLIGEAAQLVGLISTHRPIEVEELPALVLNN